MQFLAGTKYAEPRPGLDPDDFDRGETSRAALVKQGPLGCLRDSNAS
jgi:hypothetical protein